MTSATECYEDLFKLDHNKTLDPKETAVALLHINTKLNNLPVTSHKQRVRYTLTQGAVRRAIFAFSNNEPNPWLHIDEALSHLYDMVVEEQKKAESTS